MASTLYSYLGGGQNQSPRMNPANMMQKFNEFSKTVSNPKEEVEKLLANGQMSQEQFKMLSNMANNMMGRRGLP